MYFSANYGTESFLHSHTCDCFQYEEARALICAMKFETRELDNPARREEYTQFMISNPAINPQGKL